MGTGIENGDHMEEHRGVWYAPLVHWLVPRTPVLPERVAVPPVLGDKTWRREGKGFEDGESMKG